LNNKQDRLAILIDADNSQPRIIEGLLEEIANYGVASVKRIYGDWTNTQLSGWKKMLLEHGIQPIQQFAYTQGKNSTDSAMIIDAMDLLYTKNFDGFCIVTSDSDFTRLASRIRENGLTVYGFGERKTPKSFMGACDKFIYTENLRSEIVGDKKESKALHKELLKDIKMLSLIQNAVEDSADVSGWSYLANIGNIVANKSSEFDPRSYGHKKLYDLLDATKLFEFKEDEFSRKRSVYVRCKRAKRSYAR
jgi:uncharacterized LabA/DUF88 family protein